MAACIDSPPLEAIGFYTLSDYRAQQSSDVSPMWRCEMIVTGRCNFRCPYCRGIGALSRDCGADMDIGVAMETLGIWCRDGLRNIRFSGGEPTLYPHLNRLVRTCRESGVERIAISTNGSMLPGCYEQLVADGVNDFSISLDACCAAFGDKMSGTYGQWSRVTENIRLLSAMTYVTVGVVLTENNVAQARQIIEFAHGLGVADIRIVSAAQWNVVVENLLGLDEAILEAHPILRYRVDHYNDGRNVRGIQPDDTARCYLVQDDSVVAGKWHFPCVIHMREGGEPIGEVGAGMRRERVSWSASHNTHNDPICRKNCLDVCIDYNNQCARFRNTRAVARTIHV